MYVNMEDYCVSVGTNTTEFVRIPVEVFVLDHHTGLYLPLENFLVHKSLDTIELCTLLEAVAAKTDHLRPCGRH
ncbi:hypothetical protein QL285_051053 [Trifolium repens]|nr:hypothetical protein QL285_051053 [Trifolium repens]